MKLRLGLAGLALMAGVVRADVPGTMLDIVPMRPTITSPSNERDAKGNVVFKENGWRRNHFRWLLEQRKKQGDCDLVFMGDSIAAGWNDKGKEAFTKYFGAYRPFNFAVSGQRTGNILWQIENGALDGFSAKAFVVMIGTNNSGFQPIEEEPPIDTATAIHGVLQAIHAKQPQARIVLMPIFPRQGLDSKARQRNEAVNKYLTSIVDGRTVIFFDIGDLLMNRDGTLVEGAFTDGLHLAEKGFDIWGAALAPKIAEIMSAKPGDVIAGRFPAFVPPLRFSLEKSQTNIPSSGLDYRSTFGRLNDVWRRVYEKRRQIVNATNGTFDVVMIGDSITQRWEYPYAKDAYAKLCARYSVLNLGYNGQGVRGALWHAVNGELDGYAAKVVTVMIGTNNGGGPEGPIAEIPFLLEAIRRKQPQAKILLMPIFPRGATADDPRRLKNDKVNEFLCTLADGETIIYLDEVNRFLNPDGSIGKDVMGDYLHPTGKGYQIWYDFMTPVLDGLLGRNGKEGR